MDAENRPTATAHDEGDTTGVESAGAAHLPSGGPVAAASSREQGAARPAPATGGQGGWRSNGERPLVYAVGTIGTDFPTEARQDGFRQAMDPVPALPTADGMQSGAPADPCDPEQLYDFLVRNPWASDKLTWTLSMDSTPVYALEAESAAGMDWSTRIFDPGLGPDQLEQLVGRPDELVQVLLRLATPPVSTVHRTFRDAIVGQARPNNDPGFISRVAVPGRLTDRTARLFSGQVVPVVEVTSRGLHTWSEADLISSVLRDVRADTDRRGLRPFDEALLRETVRAFLDKVYHRFRNLGQSAAHRALNYAGANPFLSAGQISQGLLSAEHVPGADDLLYALDSIRVSRSPHCRPGSDCQDVTVEFVAPGDGRRSRVTYLTTVDVSDDLPVSLAPVHRVIGDR